jgi:hypothetical protein
MNRKSFCIAALCAFLSACAGFEAVQGGDTVLIGNGVTIVPQVAWSQATTKTEFGPLWTIDGIGLNELRFYTAIAPGRPLMRIPGVEIRDLGRYEGTMLADDVMNLFASTMDKAGHQQIRTAALRPAPFGAVTGFRFDFTYATMDGLQMKGMVLAAQRAGRLDLIMFSAPAEYYFDRYAPTVEQIFASVRTSAPVQARAS